MGERIATRRDVSRLFARAAFGATAHDLDSWAGRPYEEVVDALLDVPPTSPRLQFDEARRTLEEQANRSSGDDGLSRAFVASAQRWWLERMRTTPYPLEERMTLFWHDHFATGYLFPFPDVGMLVQQNQTLRRHALGNFRDLLAAVTLDPAMLYWLNGNDNQRLAPNENYARELMELFTIGTMPQAYEEHDVREAARVLTGFQTDPVTRMSRFNANRHDTASKVVLGRTIAAHGNVEYLDLIDVLLDHHVDVAGRGPMKLGALFVAYKLVLNFSYVPVTGDLAQDPNPLVSVVAAALESDWDIRRAVRTMLLADEFVDADVTQGRQVVRQPIEQVVAICKALGVSADAAESVELLGRMGQLPFDPPNVGGWPFGKDWLSPVTTLARYDWGVAAFELWRRSGLFEGPPLPAPRDLEAWTARMGLDTLSPNTRESINVYLDDREHVASQDELSAGVLILLASSPDWMVM